MSPGYGKGDRMLDFNERQRVSLAKLCHDVIKIVFGGMAVAGIMRKEVPCDKICLALAISGIFVWGSLALEDEPEEHGK
jgi:hypothetical protein